MYAAINSCSAFDALVRLEIVASSTAHAGSVRLVIIALDTICNFTVTKDAGIFLSFDIIIYVIAIPARITLLEIELYARNCQCRVVVGTATLTSWISTSYCCSKVTAWESWCIWQ